MSVSRDLLRLLPHLLLLCLFSAPLLQAETSKGISRTHTSRVALLIGNGNYPDAPLRNPVNDARTMGGLLQKAGFDVTVLENIGKREFVSAVRNFGNKLRESDAALFYFSGHGIQHQGRNWLIPVDADVQRESDIEFEALNSERILAEMEGGTTDRVNILIMDACRNNPAFRSFRSASRGLAQPRIQPEGSLVAFSTAPGTIAYDGEGENSPYVAELKKYLLTPGLKIEDLFKRVRLGVKQRTLNKKQPQVPWENSSLVGDFFFMGSKKDSNLIDVETAASSGAVVGREFNADEEAWKLIKDSNQVDDFKFFLKEYPDSKLSGVARLKIRKLERQKSKETNKNNRLSKPSKYFWNTENKIWESTGNPSDQWLYEGEMKDGWLNGLGILKSPNGDYIYSGNFEMGMSTGHGIETYKDGSRYEGGFVKGLREGSGKLYGMNGGLIYQGQFKANRRHGSGKAFHENGKMAFDGNWNNNQKTGPGDLFDENGVLIFQGSFVEDLPEGSCKEFRKDGSMLFKGIYLQGRRHGSGRIYYTDGTIQFDGEFIEGYQQGQGKEFREDGSILYDGFWLRGRREGKGKLFSNRGVVRFEGDFLKGLIEGKGSEFREDGSLFYQGDFLKGQRKSGKGRYFLPGNILIYDGDFAENTRHGYGIEFREDGTILYEGYFEKGNRHGSGKLFNERSELIFEGNFINGEKGFPKRKQLKIKESKNSKSSENFISAPKPKIYE